MAELKTDEETVEDIKKWWKENATAIILGVAIGLGAIFGWRAWMDHREGVGQRGSLAFEQVLVATAGGDTDSAVAQADKLIEDFGGSVYAMLAELAKAKAQLEADDPQAALDALSAAVDQAPDPGLARLAALRLARLQIDQGQLDAARRTIDTHDDAGPFHGDFAALRADIAAADGETETAASLYREALDAGTGFARVIELTLAELEPEPLPTPVPGEEIPVADAPAPSAEDKDAGDAGGEANAAQVTEETDLPVEETPATDAPAPSAEAEDDAGDEANAAQVPEETDLPVEATPATDAPAPSVEDEDAAGDEAPAAQAPEAADRPPAEEPPVTGEGPDATPQGADTAAPAGDAADPEPASAEPPPATDPSESPSDQADQPAESAPAGADTADPKPE